MAGVLSRAAHSGSLLTRGVRPAYRQARYASYDLTSISGKYANSPCSSLRFSSAHFVASSSVANHFLYLLLSCRTVARNRYLQPCFSSMTPLMPVLEWLRTFELRMFSACVQTRKFARLLLSVSWSM